MVGLDPENCQVDDVQDHANYLHHVFAVLDTRHVAKIDTFGFFNFSIFNGCPLLL
jgi:hypothetical protein